TLRATLYRDGRRIWTSRIGIGARATPTPPGRFWIRSRLRGLAHSPAYGPYAFGTGAYSVLSDWPGGGVIGIHGTNQPQLIPGRPSHGCVRLPNAAITRSRCSTPTTGGGTSTTTSPSAGGTTTASPGANAAPVALTALRSPSLTAKPVSTPSPGIANLSGPRGPVRNPFDVTVTGRAIRSVTFSLDARRIKTVRAKAGRKKFKVTINPRGQSRRVHRVTARITFSKASGSARTVRRLTYRTTAVTHAPRFTG
ncbi:MAG: L,D-transpeptidase, partial [Actinobacteria bacterium]|nr:L,D-transpeptidase [Actinomycetota bacterium]